jgi:hypothetical protein
MNFKILIDVELSDATSLQRLQQIEHRATTIIHYQIQQHQITYMQGSIHAIQNPKSKI